MHNVFILYRPNDYYYYKFCKEINLNDLYIYKKQTMIEVTADNSNPRYCNI